MLYAPPISPMAGWLYRSGCRAECVTRLLRPNMWQPCVYVGSGVFSRTLCFHTSLAEVRDRMKKLSR